MHCSFADDEIKHIPFEEIKMFIRGIDYTKHMPKKCYVFGGRTKHEIMSLGGGMMILISQKVKEELEQSGITGAEYVPMFIENKKGMVYDDYYALLISGRSKKPDQKLCEPRFISRGSDTRECWTDMGFFFPMDSWDGSDIFLCVDDTVYTYICITEKAKKVFEKYSNCLFIEKCSEYAWPNCKHLSKGEDPFDPNAKLIT